MSREYLRLPVPFRVRFFKFIRWFLLITLAVSMVVGLLWLFNNEEQLVSRANADTRKMTEQTNEKTLRLAPSDAYIRAKKVKFGTASEIPSFEKLYQTRKKTDAKKIIRRGTISIPTLNVKSAIYEGTNEESLVWGAGTAKPNQQMGEKNYAISAHNYKQVANADTWFFSNLQNKLLTKDEVKYTDFKALAKKYVATKEGTKIYTTDKEYVYTYEVIFSEIVDAKSKYVLSDKRTKMFSNKETPIITLTTCLEELNVKKPEERIVVVGKLVEKQKWSKNKEVLYF